VKIPPQLQIIQTEQVELQQFDAKPPKAKRNAIVNVF
jgi:hypothetical protein